MTSGKFGANLCCRVGRIAHVNTAHIGLGKIALVMDGSSAKRQRFRIIGPARAATGVEHALTNAVHFIVDDDELRIKLARSAENGLAKTESPADIVDIIVDMAHEGATFHDPIRAQPVPRLDQHTFRIGHDVMCPKCVRPGEAIALNLFATVAVRRIGRKGSCTYMVTAEFGLCTIECALIAGQLRFVDPRLIVAKQGIELWPLKLEVKLSDGRCVVPALAAIRVNRVIGRRINCGAKSCLGFVLVAVKSQRHQPFSLDPPLGIEGKASITVPMLSACSQSLGTALECIEACRSGSESDDCPRPLARRQPGLDRLFARNVAVAEGQGDREAAGSCGRLKLDIGDTVVAFHMPDRARSFETRKLACCLRIGFDRWIIGCGQAEIANQAIAHWASGAIGHPQSYDRPCHAVSDQDRLFGKERRMQGAVGIVHRTVQRFDKRTVRIADFGCEGGIAILEFYGAPLTYGQTAHAILSCALECEIVDRLAVSQKPDALVRKVLDDNPHSLGSGVVISRGKEPSDLGHLARKPVAIGSCGLGITGGGETAHAIGLLASSVPPGCCPKVDPHERAAAANHKA